jgi:hypothetical protein
MPKKQLSGIEHYSIVLIGELPTMGMVIGHVQKSVETSKHRPAELGNFFLAALKMSFFPLMNALIRSGDLFVVAPKWSLSASKEIAHSTIVPATTA